MTDKLTVNVRHLNDGVLFTLSFPPFLLPLLLLLLLTFPFHTPCNALLATPCNALYPKTVGPHEDPRRSLRGCFDELTEFVQHG